GEIIHCFGRALPLVVSLAHQKGMKFVMTDLLTAPGSRPAWKHWLHRTGLRILRETLPASFTSSVTSGSYRIADACCALTPWEAQLMQYLFDAPRERVHVVPNGVEAEFFNALKKK